MSNRHRRAQKSVPDPQTGSHFPTLPLSVPLVLDLDRCLIAGDLLFESFVVALQGNVLIVFSCLYWLLTGGRPHLKRRLAAIAPLDTDLISANEELVPLAENEVRAGRPVVLATAADELLANRFRRRFTFLSRVIASDGTRNLKGARKADELRADYPQGFIYAGDSPADLPVWRHAQGVVTVGASASTRRKARALGKPTIDIDGPRLTLTSLLKSIRLQQWAKNALVFAPVALAGKFADTGAWLNAGLAFLAIGFLASATYLVNDLADLADDRRHWSKRNRPLASGRMSIPTALALIPCFFAIAAGLGLALGTAVLSVLALYGATTLSYSLKLKRVPIIDVMTLAALFTVRLLLGVVAIGALLSPWLFVFSMALFFSISLAKRHVEVVRLRAHDMEKSAGRGYDTRDEPFLLTLGVGSALSSVVLLSLYLSADAFRSAFYGAPQFLWFAPAIILLWLCRIWLLSQRGELDDDPVAFALHDRASLMLGAALGIAFLAAAFGNRLPWLV